MRSRWPHSYLCGLATELHFQRPETGTVIFTQPEEDGSGAKKVLNDKFIQT
jgi:hypothetical protein